MGKPGKIGPIWKIRASASAPALERQDILEIAD
jgi:hypothetical protein